MPKSNDLIGQGKKKILVSWSYYTDTNRFVELLVTLLKRVVPSGLQEASLRRWAMSLFILYFQNLKSNSRRQCKHCKWWIYSWVGSDLWQINHRPFVRKAIYNYLTVFKYYMLISHSNLPIQVYLQSYNWFRKKLISDRNSYYHLLQVSLAREQTSPWVSILMCFQEMHCGMSVSPRDIPTRSLTSVHLRPLYH